MRTFKFLVLIVLFLTSACVFKKRPNVYLDPVGLSSKHPGQFNYQTWPNFEPLSDRATGISLVCNIRPEYRAALKESDYARPFFNPFDLVGLRGMVYNNLKNKDFIEQAVVIFDKNNKSNLLLILSSFYKEDHSPYTFFYFWKKDHWVKVPEEFDIISSFDLLSKYLYEQTRRLLYFHFSLH